jgi:co-chaperonin GroES (HSP10)
MINPLGHKVLVQADTIEKATESGIIYHTADSQLLEQAACSIGTLIDHGDQAWRAFSKDFTGTPWCKRGDRVYFSRYAGAKIDDPVTGESYVLMNDEDICAVITGEENDD